MQLEAVDYMCLLLEWFGNVQELISLPEHLEDPDEPDELLWTDDWVTELRLSHNNHSFDTRDEREWNMAVTSREGRDAAAFDSLITEIARVEKSGELAELLNWRMPPIYHKYITTPGLQAMFEEARHAYNEERRLSTRVCLHSQGYADLVQVVTLKTTVEQLASAFRARRGIPSYMKI